MPIITKPDSSMQRIAPDETGPEMEGWYSCPPTVGQTFCFWAIDGGEEMKYLTTSSVVSVFSTLDGYIIKTHSGSVYVIREFL